MNDSLFLDFATVAERIAATTKRLEKAALLGEYFSALNDDDLARAARYFAGYLFSLRDQRVVNVGGAMLLSASLAVTDADENALRTKLVETGDFGDAVHDFWPNTAPASLTLLQVSKALEELASTSGSKAKLALVIALLQQATTPPEGKYLVKLLSGDLRVGLREGAVEDAVARLFKADLAQVQWANMLTGDIGETAVLARHNRLGEAQMRLFHPLKFMLATPAADLTEVARVMPNTFYVEDKYDGIRAQAHVGQIEETGPVHGTIINGRRAALFSRTLDEITHSFPDLLPALAELLPPGADGLIFDGEIVPLRGEQIGPFQDLQKRLGRKTPTEEILRTIPVAFVVYDALYGPDHVRLEEPFSTRRAWLESLPFDNNRLRLAPSRVFDSVAPLDDEFDAARQRGNEGLMVKAPASTYKPGKRGRDWLKIKRAIATLDVVVTSVEVGNGRRSKVLSDFTFAVRAAEDDPTLLNVGKAYSGLTDAEIAELSEWFRAHTLQEFGHGKVRVVEPEVVIEVTFDRVQPSARHKSGYALRFPRILRIRTDKPASEIDTLETVKQLAESMS
jgi:DNA ligase-1